MGKRKMTPDGQIRGGVRDDAHLRGSFNALAVETFGIDFETWHNKGYWGERYTPYVITHGETVIANASASVMPFTVCGQERRYIQLGTVMTSEKYRHQGLSRRLIAHILDSASAQGVFLFANAQVLDFYPKFGFRKVQEYSHHARVIGGENDAQRVDLNDVTALAAFEQAVLRSVPQSKIWHEDALGLTMFYLLSGMEDCVYHLPDMDAYVIAQRQEETLVLHQVFCAQAADIRAIARRFGKEICRVEAGFTPLDTTGFEASVIDDEDTTLFLYGDSFPNFAQEELRIPTLAHT